MDNQFAKENYMFRRFVVSNSSTCPEKNEDNYPW